MKHKRLACLLVLGVLAPWALPEARSEAAWSPTRRKRFVIKFAWKAGDEPGRPARILLPAENGPPQAIFELYPGKVRCLLQPGTPKTTELELKEGGTAGPRVHTAWVNVRNGSLLLGLDGQRRLDPAVQHGANPQWRWEPSPSCVLVRRPIVQPVGPITYSDDFMRSPDAAPQWEPVSGKWALQGTMTPSQAANAFRLFGKSAAPAIAVSRLSCWFWHDYRLGVSLRSDDPKAWMGLVFYYRDEGNYHVLRWVAGKRIELVRVKNGREEVLSFRRAMRSPGSWYRMTIAVHAATAQGYVDGQRLVKARDDSLLGGKVGLYLKSSQGVWFDDVEVTSIGGKVGSLFAPFGPAEKNRLEIIDKQFSSDTRMRS